MSGSEIDNYSTKENTSVNLTPELRQAGVQAPHDSAEETLEQIASSSLPSANPDTKLNNNREPVQIVARNRPAELRTGNSIIDNLWDRMDRKNSTIPWGNKTSKRVEEMKKAA